MIQTITQNTFTDAFLRSDTYKNNFTYAALVALFDSLEDYESQTGEPIEFDMVALCCEYSEYPSAIEACDDYTEDAPYLLDEDELEDIDQLELQEKQTEKALEWLEDRTQVIRIPNSDGIIIAQF